MSEPVFRPLPDYISWWCNREAGTITLDVKHEDIDLWCAILEAGGLYRVANLTGALDNNPLGEMEHERE